MAACSVVITRWYESTRSIGVRVNLKALIGVGHEIMLSTLLFALIGILLNFFIPGLFEMSLGITGRIIGWAFLLAGIPVWLSSAALVAVYVPRGRLITTGPFRLMTHPLYTSVGLLVIPGIGFLLNDWIWWVLGVVMYVSSRVFSKKEEKTLEEKFSDDYRRYRAKVLLPWL